MQNTEEFTTEETELMKQSLQGFNKINMYFPQKDIKKCYIYKNNYLDI